MGYLLLAVIGRQYSAESPSPEGIVEDKITHLSALFDPFGLIIGAIARAVLFALLRALRRNYTYLLGVLIGA
jgi:hypothetical protein